jgi:hypothetical protein
MTVVVREEQIDKQHLVVSVESYANDDNAMGDYAVGAGWGGVGARQEGELFKIRNPVKG